MRGMLQLVRTIVRACSCDDRLTDSNQCNDDDEPAIVLFDGLNHVHGGCEQDTTLASPRETMSGKLSDKQVCKVLSFNRDSVVTAGSDGESSLYDNDDGIIRASLREESAASSGCSVAGYSQELEIERSSMVMVASQTLGNARYSMASPVLVDRVYDFYDPSEGMCVVVNMSGDVIHKRVSSRQQTIKGDPDPDNPDTEDSDKGQGPATDKHKQRKAVTNWGILVGKAIWCQVNGKLQRRTGGLSTLSVGRMASCYLDRKRSNSDDGPKPAVGKQKHARLMSQNRARIVVSHARELAKRIVKEPNDCTDADWVCEDLLTFLFSAEYADTIMILAKGAQSILAEQPILVEAEAPCRIFGDTHGQLRDLLLLFRAFGGPDDDESTTYVFNGDFVDRGKHQLETVSLLFALKNLYPKRVYLIRGNHEDREMNRRYGFTDVCNKALGNELGPKCFDLIHEAFDQLPLACVVAKRILVLHGGIGNGQWRLTDLFSIKRPLKSEIYLQDNAWIFNLLWSDPIEDDDAKKTGDTFGVHGSPRNSKVVQFGWNITEQFCALNGINLVVRSHQYKEGGYGFDIMHNDKLVRVFSARDYERHSNDCAVLLVSLRQDGPPGSLVVRPQVLRSIAKPGWAERVEQYAEKASALVQKGIRLD